MLDPLTALSLAGTVVQFVDFSGKVILKAKELNSSGATQDAYHSEILTRDLLRLSTDMKKGLSVTAASGSPEEDDRILEDVCNGCILLSEKMLLRLQGLNIQEGAGRMRIFKNAVKSVWSHKELEELATQLARYRSQLELRVFVSFRDKLDLAALSNSKALDETTYHLISAMSENRNAFDNAIKNQTTILAGLQQETQKTTINEHAKTRSVILDAVQEGRLNSPASALYDNDRKNSKADIERRTNLEDRILQSFLFQSISDRREQVPKAHAATFEWIFRDPKPGDRRWSNFAKWLEAGSGIYWITGKAGSGKSTLMKYLYGEGRTRSLLTTWSGNHPLHLAEFFFWNSGTAHQKSQKGLLQSLLHQILSSNRNLIPLVFPEQYKAAEDPTELVDHWSLEKLGRAFDNLCKQKVLRICLFVDGLDEFEPEQNREEGTHSDIIALFQRMAASPNIKLCLSSRPWPVFEDGFQSSPSLRLQDLTFNDIVRYVNDKLYDHHKMKKLQEIDPAGTESLVQEIVSKASGVFLWVTLVVKSLLNGLTNRDRISDLERRLHLLPPDLEELYKSMLFKHIDPFYHQESSHIFQIVNETKSQSCRARALDLLTLMFTDEEYLDSKLATKVRSLSEEELANRCQEVEWRINSRSAGLLEVSKDSESPLNWTIDYLHRTVQDFIEDDDIWDEILDRGKSFIPKERLLNAYLQRLKLNLQYSQNNKASSDGVESEIIEDCYSYICSAIQCCDDFNARDKHKTNPALVEELAIICQLHWLEKEQREKVKITRLKGGNSHGCHFPDCPFSMASTRIEEDSYQDFLSLAVGFNQLDYVFEKLTPDPSLLTKKRGTSLLDYAVFTRSWRTKMIPLLLQHGASPNDVLNGISTWQHLLVGIKKRQRPFKNNDKAETFVLGRVIHETQPGSLQGLFKMLLEAGANPNALCQKVEAEPSQGASSLPPPPLPPPPISLPLSPPPPPPPLPPPRMIWKVKTVTPLRPDTFLMKEQPNSWNHLEVSLSASNRISLTVKTRQTK